MIQKRFLLIIKFFRAEKQNIRVRSWSRPFFLEHESRIFSLEPEAALGHRTTGTGAAQKSGGSATLDTV